MLQLAGPVPVVYAHERKRFQWNLIARRSVTKRFNSKLIDRLFYTKRRGSGLKLFRAALLSFLFAKG